jgi:RND family efflux transporter MFP subunit
MKSRTVLIVVVTGAAGFAAGLLAARAVRAVARLTGIAPGPGAHAPAPPAAGLWTCGMHPQVIQDHPGLCPICHMDLTPLRGDDEAAEATSTVTIDPAVVQNMGVRIAPVTEGVLRRSIRAVGTIEEAQPRIRDVSLRVSGWITRLHADTEGMSVGEGDPLFELYSPELRVAAGELIAARRALERAGDDDGPGARSARLLHDAAVEKLVLLGLGPEDVDAMSRLESAPETVTFRSPIAGEIIEKPIVEGAAVNAGDRALRIVDHSVLWLDARVFEKDLPFVAVGQEAVATLDALPGEVFEGRVIFLYPHVDATTRTATARLELPNPGMTLRPGMYATVRIEAPLDERAVLVPREAVIDTGVRQVAFVAAGEGRFQPRDVVLGHAAADGMVQVLQGLAPGEPVVVSGQFLLDSESRLRESVRKFLDERSGAPAPPAPPAPPAHQHGGAPAAPALPPAEPDPRADGVLAAYLVLSERLGLPQTSDAPVDPEALVAAAHALHASAAGTATEPLALRVAAGAESLRDQPLDRQRERFKSLSEAVIALAERHPPSGGVPGPLFVMYCPMAPGSWIQATEVVNNPYYATAMKRYGEVKRTIAAGARP